MTGDLVKVVCMRFYGLQVPTEGLRPSVGCTNYQTLGTELVATGEAGAHWGLAGGAAGALGGTGVWQGRHGLVTLALFILGFIHRKGFFFFSLSLHLWRVGC